MDYRRWNVWSLRLVGALIESREQTTLSRSDVVETVAQLRLGSTPAPGGFAGFSWIYTVPKLAENNISHSSVNAFVTLDMICCKFFHWRRKFLSVFMCPDSLSDSLLLTRRISVLRPVYGCFPCQYHIL